MFTISKNDLLVSKRVTYEDGKGNRLLVKLNDEMNAVTLKLRFADETLSAEAVTIDIPISPNFKGVNVNFNREPDETEIEPILNDFAEIGNRWMEIPYLLNAFAMNAGNPCERLIVMNALRQQYPFESTEKLEALAKEVATDYLIEEMKKFDEFEPLIQIFVVER